MHLQEYNRRRFVKTLLAGLGMRFSYEMNVGIDLCHKYALSLPVSTVITGMRNSGELQVALDSVRNFTSLTEEEIHRLLDETKATGSDGYLEGYKNPHGNFGCSHQSAVLRSERNQ